MTTTITAGSYWRARRNEILVKVIVPHATAWVWRDETPVVVFRTHSNRYGEAMQIVQYFATVDDFLTDFEPAIWDKEKLIWQ
jgi:hypothetical protein